MLLLCTLLLSLVACKDQPELIVVNEDLSSINEPRDTLELPEKAYSTSEIIVSKPFQQNSLDQSALKPGEVFIIGFPFRDFYGVFSSNLPPFYESLYIVDGYGKFLNKLHNVTLVNQPLGVLDTSQKQLMGIYEAGKTIYGLYDFKAMDWAIEPLYTDLRYVEGYYYVVKDGFSGVIDSDGHIVIPFELLDKEYTCFKYDEYFVFDLWEENLFTVYDLEGNKIIENSPLSITGFGHYLFYIDYAESGQCYLADEEGNILFGPEDYSNLLLSYDGKQEGYLIYNDGMHYNIYDVDLNLLLKYPNNKDMLRLGRSDHYYYSYDKNGNAQYYWLDGTEIFSSSGNAYTRTVNNMDYTKTYLAQEAENGIELLDVETRKEYFLPVLADSLYNFSVSENGFYSSVQGVDNGDIQFTFYDADDNLKLTQSSEYFYSTGEQFILQTDHTLNNLCHNIVLSYEGDIIYESKYKDRIQICNDQYIFVERGNYSGITDLDGNWIYKIGPQE